MTVREKVRNARAQRIEALAGLRVDSAAVSHLDAAIAAEDPDRARALADTFLVQAHELAVQTAAAEIARLDDAAVRELRDRYLPGRPATQDELVDAYRSSADRTLAAARRRVDQAPTAEALRDVLREIERGVETPIKRRGKTVRVLTWLPFYLPAKMAADRVRAEGPGCPLFLGEFDAADVYAPTPGDSGALARHAPWFVVERAAEPAYDPDADRIGRVVADGGDRVSVRTDQPVVYAYARRIMLAGREHEQLVYAAWFPEHPALEDNDPMAGHVDGLTVRITLDRAGRLAVVETMANCGCFHGLYPTRGLEAAARAEFGPPEDAMRYTLERDAGRKLNAHIPGLLELAEDGARPMIYVAAGWHSIVHVTLESHGADRTPPVPYALKPYADLELLPTPDGRFTSMFYDNGLVRDAQRPEGVYFTPLGMLSAGQPRQRETQLIYWDQYDFDEPGLLARLLRLPSGF